MDYNTLRVCFVQLKSPGAYDCTGPRIEAQYSRPRIQVGREKALQKGSAILRYDCAQDALQDKQPAVVLCHAVHQTSRHAAGPQLEGRGFDSSGVGLNVRKLAWQALKPLDDLAGELQESAAHFGCLIHVAAFQ